MLTSSVDRTARLWDLREKKCVRVFTDHAGEVACAHRVVFVFLCNGTVLGVRADFANNRFATSSFDETALVYDLRTLRRLALLEGPRGRCVFSHDSNFTQ